LSIKKYKNLNRHMLNESVADFSCSLEGGAIVVDLGAGSGHYRSAFKRNRYYAIDMGLEQSGFKGLDLVGDICRLPFKASSIDHVLCIEILEHIYDFERFMNGVGEVLKPGGKMLLTVPLGLGVHMAPYDYHRLTRFGIEKMAEKCGFNILKIEARGGYFTFMAYHLRAFPVNILGKRPGFAGKLLKSLLNPFFGYLLPFFVSQLDKIQKHEHTTLGYICILENGRSNEYAAERSKAGGLS